MKKKLKNFSGVGTVFSSSIVNISNLLEQFGPLDLIDNLKLYLDHVTSVIEKHGGIVLKFEGDAVLALWYPTRNNTSHAQFAFDAACEVIEKHPPLVHTLKNIFFDVDIVLSTSDLAGNFFGSNKQFQVIGTAMAITDRLNSVHNIQGTMIRMSQYTVDIIKPKDGIKKIATITRDNLEDLKVFTYCPANKKILVPR